MAEIITQIRKTLTIREDNGPTMSNGLANKYQKSYITRPSLLILGFAVSISIPSHATAANAVDISLEWNASTGADEYRICCREAGPSLLKLDPIRPRATKFLLNNAVPLTVELK